LLMSFPYRQGLY